MTGKTANSMHWNFWLVGATALLWNVLGVVNYLVQMNADSLSSYREIEQALIVGRPAWATGAFAIAVFAGALGSLLLLLRKSISYYFLVASLFGVCVTMIHSLGADIHFGIGEILGIVMLPITVAVFLVWYARKAGRKGWIT